MSIESQGHFFITYFFQVLYVLCFTRPRYQVSVYRTIGPLVSFPTAAGVPGTGVASRWLECRTPIFSTFLFSGSMLLRLHILMSALTHSDEVFLDLPLFLVLGIVILVIEFLHEEEVQRVQTISNA